MWCLLQSSLRDLYSPVLLKFLPEIRLRHFMWNWNYALVGPLDFTHSFPTPDSKGASLLTEYNMKAVFPPLMVFLELLKKVLLF